MTSFDLKTIALKDGRNAVIRCGRDTDSSAILELFKVLFLDGEGMIGEADEGAQAEEEVKTFIKTHLDGPRNLLLLAEVDGLLVGTINFTVGKRRRCAHWGTFAMGVRPGWRSCGVGNALLTCLLDWAISVPEIEKVTLAVRADNTRAIALYEKHGFVLCGCDKAYLKMSDGSFVDDLRMERFVR